MPLKKYLLTGHVIPTVEARFLAGQRPPSGMNCFSRRLIVVEEPRRNLEQNLRLCVTAHRAEDGDEVSVPGRKGRRKSMGWSPTGAKDCRVTRFERESKTAIMQIDLCIWLSEPGPESRGIRLDERNG
jgi:hypothetical protein